MGSSEILVFSDGSYSIKNGESPQLEYIIITADNNYDGHIIDFSSKKSRKVVRSVLGSETFVMTDSCVAEIVIQHDLIKILKKKLKIKLLTDSENLFNIQVSNSSTMERRPLIDAARVKNSQ